MAAGSQSPSTVGSPLPLGVQPCSIPQGPFCRICPLAPPGASGRTPAPVCPPWPGDTGWLALTRAHVCETRVTCWPSSPRHSEVGFGFVLSLLASLGWFWCSLGGGDVLPGLWPPCPRGHCWLCGFPSAPRPGPQAYHIPADPLSPFCFQVFGAKLAPPQRDPSILHTKASHGAGSVTLWEYSGTVSGQVRAEPRGQGVGGAGWEWPPQGKRRVCRDWDRASVSPSQAGAGCSPHLRPPGGSTSPRRPCPQMCDPPPPRPQM